MAKRRAEESLLSHSTPQKWRRVRAVDMPLESMAALDPPSLLVLMGGTRRKRPHHFVEPEEKQPEEPLLFSAGVPNSDDLVSGNFQSHAPASSKKRAREESVHGSEEAPRSVESADPDFVPEDFNSFQYWRTPLPELDLSLLEETTDQTQARQETKHKPPSELMET